MMRYACFLLLLCGLVDSALSAEQKGAKNGWQVVVDSGDVNTPLTDLSVDGGDIIAANAAHLGSLVEWDPSTDNTIFNPDLNTVGSLLRGVTIQGGLDSTPNRVGYAGRPVSLGGESFPAYWVEDTAWPDDDENAGSLATIAGGYDNIVNQIAGYIGGGGHNQIAYHVDGHSVIVGGASNYISQGRGTIGGGKLNAIYGTGIYSEIMTGFRNQIQTGSHNLIVSGQDNVIESGQQSVIMSGQDNTVAASQALIVGGTVNDISATDGTIGGGSNNTVSGSQGTIPGGLRNTVSHAGAITMGNDGVSIAPGSLNMSRTKFEEAGDCQWGVVPMGGRWNDASAHDLSSTGGTTEIDLTDDANQAGVLEVDLVGMKDGSADGNNDSAYQCVYYHGRFGYWWNGTLNYLVDSDSETSASGSTVSLDLVEIGADIPSTGRTNHDFTPAATPVLRINSSGRVMIRVQGVAATYVKWTGVVRYSRTLIR